MTCLCRKVSFQIASLSSGVTVATSNVVTERRLSRADSDVELAPKSTSGGSDNVGCDMRRICFSLAADGAPCDAPVVTLKTVAFCAVLLAATKEVSESSILNRFPLKNHCIVLEIT